MATAVKPSAPKKTGNQISFAQIKAGDLMAITSFVTVDEVRQRGDEGQPTIHVIDVDNRQAFRVVGKPLIERAASADRYATSESRSKTELAEILTRSWNKPFTVIFEKQGGEMRTMRGRLVEPEPLMGRSHVQDLDKASDPTDKTDGLRLVDHRTIQELIVDGVRYTLRKR